MMGRDMVQGVSMESEATRSRGWKDECSVNTWRRCSTKTSTVSMSLFAQLPSDCPTWCIDTWGSLKLLVALHMEVSGEST